MKIDENQSVLSLEDEIPYLSMEADEFLIMPQQFVLATTEEYIEIPDDLTASIQGRSSIGRAGLFIQNAGWVESGFKGNITLELYNANRSTPILLKAGRRVCQIIIETMDMPVDNPYDGKYQNQRKTWGSLINLDSELEGDISE